MSDRLTEKLAADIDAERKGHVKIAADLHLRAAGFRPTRLAKGPTADAPRNAYLAPARPGMVYTVLNEAGLATMPPGLIESINPAVAERIGIVADGIRRVGVPVVVVMCDTTPTKDDTHE